MRQKNKKTIICLLLILLLLGPCFAATKTYLDNLSRGLQVYGYIDQYCIIYTSPLEATDTPPTGMPFAIDSSDVAYNSNDAGHITGREIATWSFATNMPSVRLTFNAERLVHEEETSYSLGYYMTFRYEYAGEDENGNSTSNNGYITVHSGEEKVLTITNHIGASGLPIISMAKDVRFQFDQAYDLSDFPAGFYYSNITITMEGL